MFKSISNWFKERSEERKRLFKEQLNARASVLEDGKEYDLLYLYKSGFVNPRATGQSITRIYGEIENLIEKKLNVIIEPGTYFVANGNFQNMVTREDYSVSLYPNSTARVTIDAACINANLPIPGERDRFSGVNRVSNDLTQFLIASTNADRMTVQAGVWAITDNYTGEAVKAHLVSVDQYGNRHQAVSDRHIDEARRILRKIGVQTRL